MLLAFMNIFFYYKVKLLCKTQPAHISLNELLLNQETQFGKSKRECFCYNISHSHSIFHPISPSPHFTTPTILSSSARNPQGKGNNSTSICVDKTERNHHSLIPRFQAGFVVVCCICEIIYVENNFLSQWWPIDSRQKPTSPFPR